MLSFFRRALSSPLIIGLLGLIAIAFIITGVGTPSGLGALRGGGDGTTVATVGGRSIGEAEAARRAQLQLESARQQQQGLDMTAFVASGEIEQTVDQMINARAIEAFAQDQGMVASKRLVDGAIASIPAFQGPSGAFDRTTFLTALAQRKIPESQVREDFAREAMTRALLLPVAGAAGAPRALVEPYAALLLEARSGQLASVPSATFTSGAPPSDAAVAAFYTRNIARYTLPERRIVKYALFDRSRFEGKITATDAEIAAFYKANAATYAGRETRAFTQIIVPDQAKADTIAAKVRAGANMADAAKAAGFEALPVAATDRATFEKLSSPAVAAAAFGAAKGAVVPIARSGFGFHIVRVDSIVSIAEKSLAEARTQIAADVGKQKVDEALADLVAKIEDDISGGATFDEAVRKFGLAATVTPPLTASGVAPDQPGYHSPSELSIVLREAFQADPDDHAAVATIGAGNAFALYHLDSIVPAAPRSLAAIRAQVAADAAADAASRAAKRVADQLAAAVNSGKPLAAAIGGAGVRLPSPTLLSARRMDLARQGERAPPPLALMFVMAERRAKVLAAPNGAGWYVVTLDRIERGDPRAAQPLIAATQSQLARVVGDEYVAQFVNAIKAQVGVKRNDAGVAALKRALTGGASRQ